MSEMWPDEDVETTDLFGNQESADDYLGDSEGFEEEGSYDDAEASAATVRRRRERARRLALAQRRERTRRAALARSRTRRPIGASGVPPTTKAAVRTTQAAVRTLDLENKVQADVHKSALAAQGKRTTRAEMATVASAVISQFAGTFEDRFDLLKQPLAKAAIAFAPLMFLSPAKHGSGVGAYARDPRVFGGAAIAAILAAHKLTEKKPTAVQRIDITPASPPPIAAKASAQLAADAFDGNGKNIPGTVFTWDSTNKTVATVAPDTDSATAQVKILSSAANGQTSFITAIADGVTGRVQVTVS